MDPNRKRWNLQQKDLRHALTKSGSLKKIIELFLIQHAMVHSAKLNNSMLFSFEDEILGDATDEIIRRMPKNGNHSIAWVIWHLARVEDVTMNLLAAGRSQVLYDSDWLGRMKIKYRHTGNGMNDDDIVRLSDNIDIEALKAYRLAVGRATEKMVKNLKSEDFKRKVEPSRIQRLWDEKAMLEGGRATANYWSKKNITGLLLMPPTRHCFLHLNEARRLKEYHNS